MSTSMLCANNPSVQCVTFYYAKITNSKPVDTHWQWWITVVKYQDLFISIKYLMSFIYCIMKQCIVLFFLKFKVAVANVFFTLYLRVTSASRDLQKLTQTCRICKSNDLCTLMEFFVLTGYGSYNSEQINNNGYTQKQHYKLKCLLYFELFICLHWKQRCSSGWAKLSFICLHFASHN